MITDGAMGGDVCVCVCVCVRQREIKRLKGKCEYRGIRDPLYSQQYGSGYKLRKENKSSIMFVQMHMLADLLFACTAFDTTALFEIQICKLHRGRQSFK